MIWLPCRHHVAELVLASVISVWEGNTSGPQVLDYNDFKHLWNNNRFDKDKYKSFSIGSNKTINGFSVDEISNYLERELKNPQIRGDYKELLQLALTFLGKHKPLRILRPGATSRARWMQKAIYSLKMYLFREETEVRDIKLLEDICLFIVFVYIPYWFNSTIAFHSLKNDIGFMENINKFGKKNKTIADKALAKFKDHLWYMGYHPAALGFFDDRMSLTDKRKMWNELQKDKKATDESNRRLVPQAKKTYKLEDCVSQSTREFFEIMKLDMSFLEKDPKEWTGDESYEKTKNQISYIHVVNDAGERALSSLKDIRSKKESNFQQSAISRSFEKQTGLQN